MKTKYVFLFIFFKLNVSFVYSQKDTLFIIGSLHRPSKTINDTSYLNALKKARPDIILLEAGPSQIESCNFKINPKEKAIEIGTGKIPVSLLNPLEPEIRASFIYKFGNDNKVCIKPLDIDIKDRNKVVKEYSQSEKLFWQFIDSLSKTNLKEPEKNLISDIQKINSSRRALQKSLYELNSVGFDSLSRKYHDLLRGLKNFMVENKQFALYNAHLQNRIDFILDKRNNVFIKNISNEIIKKGTKRIIVIVGANHKTYIKDHFAKSKDVIVKEYYDL